MVFDIPVDESKDEAWVEAEEYFKKLRGEG